jgi:hypothetical protein
MIQSLKQLCAIAVQESKLDTFQIPECLQTLVQNLFACCKKEDVTIAVQQNHLDCLLRCTITIDSNLTKLACFYNSLDCLVYLVQHGCEWHWEAADYACKNNALSCLRYAVHVGAPLNFNSCAVHAASWGSAECLEFCLKNGAVPSSLIVTNALRIINVPCLQVAIANGCPLEPLHSILAVTKYPKVPASENIKCLKILYLHNCPMDKKMLQIAVQYRMVECLEFCLNIIGLVPTPLDTAYGTFDVQFLKFLLLSKKFPVDELVVAMSSNNLESLKFLHQDMGFSWNSSTTKFAVMFNNLQSLAYAKQHGCPWDPTAMKHVSNLNILQFLHLNGCPWNESTLEGFVQQFSYFQYAFEHGCPASPNIMESIVRTGDLSILRYAISKKIVWTNACVNIAKTYFGIDFVMQVVYNGAPCNPIDVYQLERNEQRFALLANGKIVVGQREYIRKKYEKSIIYEGLCYCTKKYFFKESNKTLEQLREILKKLNEPKNIICKHLQKIDIIDNGIYGIRIKSRKCSKLGNSYTCARGFINCVQQAYQEETGHYLIQRKMCVFPKNKPIFYNIVKRLLNPINEQQIVHRT